jgi:predicted phosphatase
MHSKSTALERLRALNRDQSFKYCWFKKNQLLFELLMANLVVIRTIGRFFYAGMFLLISNLNTDKRIHVESSELSCLDDRHRNLKRFRSQNITGISQFLDARSQRDVL